MHGQRACLHFDVQCSFLTLLASPGTLSQIRAMKVHSTRDLSWHHNDAPGLTIMAEGWRKEIRIKAITLQG